MVTVSVRASWKRAPKFENRVTTETKIDGHQEIEQYYSDNLSVYVNISSTLEYGEIIIFGGEKIKTNYSKLFG